MRGLLDGPGVDTTVRDFIFIFLNHERLWPARRWGGSAQPWSVLTAGWLLALINRPTRCFHHLWRKKTSQTNSLPGGSQQGIHFAASVLRQWCQGWDELTHSEVNVAFPATHDQVRFGLWGHCVRGFRWRVIGAWIYSAWRGHRLTCDD